MTPLWTTRIFPQRQANTLTLHQITIHPRNIHLYPTLVYIDTQSISLRIYDYFMILAYQYFQDITIMTFPNLPIFYEERKNMGGWSDRVHLMEDGMVARCR